jgi:hypothetical protein
LAEPTIPGLTLGASRRFLIRHKQTKETVEFAPAHGSLIVMRRRTNADWVHSVPKQLREKGERLNLTFRQMGGQPMIWQTENEFLKKKHIATLMLGSNSPMQNNL